MTYQITTLYEQHRQGRAKGEGFEREQFKNRSNDFLALALPATLGSTTKKAHSQTLSALALQHINKIILITDIQSSMKLSHLINLFIQLVLQLYFLITAARTSLQGCLSYCSKFNSSKYKNCS